MFAFLQSRPWITALFLLAALAAGLGLFDRLERAFPTSLAAAGERALDANLERAAGLFATARLIDAALSVAGSTEVSAGVGVQGAVVPGRVLEPIDDLVERFSAVMLSATVVLGVASLLVQAGDVYGFTVFLPVGLVAAAVALWLPGPVGAGAHRVGLMLLMAALIAKLGLPLAVLGTELVANRLTEPLMIEATARLEAVDLPDMPGQEEQGWLDRLGAMADLTAQMREAAAVAADLADTLIDLTIAWVLKIVLLPLILLWLLGRVGQILVASLLPRPPG